jgi:hypothetical protein
MPPGAEAGPSVAGEGMLRASDKQLLEQVHAARWEGGMPRTISKNQQPTLE